MPLLEVRDLGVGTQLRGASLSLAAGECVGLIGPNGAGKTTLLRAALGLVRHQGTASLAALTPAARARHAAFLPQTRAVAWPVTVRDLVALGRMPWRAAKTISGGDPGPAVEAALAQVGLRALAGRQATTLSGGELARALLARVLVQDTPLILADEPAAGLDPAQQIGVLRLLRSLADQGRGVLVSLHDLSLAARHCTRVVVLHQGRIIADGPPLTVLTPDLLDRVFGLRALWLDSDEGPILHAVGLTDGGA